MSGRKPASGAKPAHSGSTVAARTIQTAATAMKTRARTSSPLRSLTYRSFSEQLAVQLLLVGEEGLELLARDGRRLRDVLLVVLLHLRGVVDLDHHPFPVGARRVGRALRDGDAAPHLEVGRLDALLLEGRHVVQAGEALVAHHAERADLAGLQLAHELERVAHRGLYVPAEQRGEGLAAAVEAHRVVLHAGRLGEHRHRHHVGGAAGGEGHRLRRLALRVLDEVARALPRRVGAHEEQEVVEHQVRHRRDLGERLRLRVEDRRDLGAAVDEDERVRVGLAARRDVADADRAAAAALVDERDRHRDQLLVDDDLVDDAGHQVGAAAEAERNHELDFLAGLPALRGSSQRYRHEEQQTCKQAHGLSPSFGKTILVLMGMLIEGVWKDVPRDTKSSGGAFVRPESVFRDRVGDQAGEMRPGRYRLYVSKSCPWAHRTLIVRALKGLEKALPVSYADPHLAENGWRFPEGYLYQIYLKARPGYTGRVTVPVLWDAKEERIVNNESAEIIRMLNREFDALARRKLHDLYPEKHKKEIDWLNERIYRTVNNGVYRAGFATAQDKYEAAVSELFRTLDWLAQVAARPPVQRGRRAPVHHARAFRRGVLL